MLPVTDKVLLPATPLACVKLPEPIKPPTLRLLFAISRFPFVRISTPVFVNAAVNVTLAALLIVISEVVGIAFPVTCAALPLYITSDPAVYVLVPVTLILPVPAVVEIPVVEATFKIPVALKVKSEAFVPLAIKPALPKVRSPLLANIPFVAVLYIFTVPNIDPIQVEPNVICNRAVPSVPKEQVIPAVTENVPVTVIVLPLAVGTKLQLPLIVKLAKLIVGTAVIAAD